MSQPTTIELDAVILGGGIAGLWTLSELTRRGMAGVLIEARALGQGQTLWSQGIIHGGLKYSLSGLLTGSARAIREMPEVWRACLAGEREPDLSGAPVRAPHCHLWQTTDLRSRAGMIGARIGLRVAPVPLAPEERPTVLRDCPGVVARLDEQVIDPGAVLSALARPLSDRIILAPPDAVRFERDPLVVAVPGARFAPRRVILCAGRASADLRRAAGLAGDAMQVRPLRMVMLRAPAARLPELNAHCVDGNRTRVTITSVIDAGARRIWQIGGEIAERGAAIDPPALLSAARAELLAVLPSVDLSPCEWSWYQADRAERATPGAKRPEDIGVIEEGPFLTAWPTKLALAPRLAERLADLCGSPQAGPWTALPAGLHHPAVALPPWDEPREWTPDSAVAPG